VNEELDTLSPTEDDGLDLRNTMWAKATILCCSCCFLVGSYYCFDIPGSLNKQIKDIYHIEQDQSQLLYTLYSVPNFVLPMIGGLILDKIGIRIGLIMFSIILTIG